MTGDWSNEVRRDFAGGEARFDFPVRSLGWGRLFGIVLVGFGLVFVWGPIHMAWGSIQKLHQGGTDVFNIIFAVFPLLFVVAGSVPLGIGLLILFGRCRVEWKDGTLRSTELLGPLRWTRRLPRKPVRRLQVGAATSRSGNSPPRELNNFSGLVAEYEDGTKKLVVIGYPKDWLLALAEELRGYVGGGALATESPAVEVVEKASLDDHDDDDVLKQPAGSRVQVEEHAAGVRLTVPPAGLWRGSKGMFFFALIWCGFMTFFTVTMALNGFKMDGEVWIPILFVLVFWAIGFGLLAGAINMARRTATLAAEGGRLQIETRGLFGTKQHEWSHGELAAIRADASGMEVNDRPVIELQIHPVAGKKVGVLAGRDEAELRWMATRLRRALNVRARL